MYQLFLFPLTTLSTSPCISFCLPSFLCFHLLFYTSLSISSATLCFTCGLFVCLFVRLFDSGNWFCYYCLESYFSYSRIHYSTFLFASCFDMMASWRERYAWENVKTFQNVLYFYLFVDLFWGNLLRLCSVTIVWKIICHIQQLIIPQLPVVLIRDGSLKRKMSHISKCFSFIYDLCPLGPNFASICYYPFMVLLQPDEYVDLMLQSLSNIASTTEGSMTIALARDLSNKLYRKYCIRAKLKQGNAQQVHWA